MPDLRVRRTKQILRQALMDLMNEKSYETITVAEIAERAMVNRTTFYRHYEDKSDLFTRGMDEMLDEIWSTLWSVPEEIERSEIDKPRQNTLAMLNHIKHNLDFYKLMFGPRGSGDFVLRMRDSAADAFRHRLAHVAEHNKATARIPLVVLAHMWAGSLLGLLAWWVKEDCRVAVEDAAVFLAANFFVSRSDLLNVPMPPVGGEFLALLEAAARRMEDA